MPQNRQSAPVAIRTRQTKFHPESTRKVCSRDHCELDDPAGAMANGGMSIKILAPDDELRAAAPRSVTTAMLRGAAHHCPACGKGALFSRYLKVTDRCESCGTDLYHQRADDAPPYFTIFIVGHIVLFGVMIVEQMFAPPPWIQALIWMPLTLALCLILLPCIKGAIVGLQWALRMHGFGNGPDPAAPDPIEQPGSMNEA